MGKLSEYARFFYIQRIKGFDIPQFPSLDPETLAFLTDRLRTSRSYVEFGSGGSTILADKMGVATVSVEGDKFFAKAVNKGLRGGTVTMLTPDIGMTGPWGWPIFKRLSKARLARWRSYVEAPFAHAKPDLILVDGRFRVACALETARRVTRGTLIVDDYEPRPHYRQIEKYLGKPEMIGRAAVFTLSGQDVPQSAVSVHEPA